jgi:ABC-type transport system involved in Fe-S cluster assembly fused permease/ATPase subunit
VIGLLWANYDIFFAGISLLTVVFYVAFTLAITTWRMKYRYATNTSGWSSASTIPLSATGTATFANLATIKNKVAKITRVRIFNK